MEKVDGAQRFLSNLGAGSPVNQTGLGSAVLTVGADYSGANKMVSP